MPLLGANTTVIVPAVILGIYALMMVGIAVYSRRRSKSVNDFLLAGDGLGGWMSAFAYGTTYFSSVIFIGYAGKFGWNFGLAAVWIGIANALIGAYLAWKVLAKRTRAMTHKLGARTMPEFFTQRYDSKGLKLFSALIIFIFLIPYSASVYQGLSYLFELIFGIDFIWCVFIMAALTALYLFFGGYFATAMSDFIQGIIMIIGVIAMTFMLLARPEVDWGEGLSQLTQNGLGIFPNGGGEGLWNQNWFNVVVLLLLTSFGMWGLPQSVHKFYAIKDNAAIKKGTVISSLFCLVIGFGAYFCGALVTLFVDKLPEGGFDMLVPTMLVKALPAPMLGLIMVLILSASMSTLSSLSLAGASAFAVDGFKGYIRPNASDKQVNVTLKLACLFFVVISVVIAVFQPAAIVTLMSLSWGVLAGCFIGPYVLGLFSKRITKAACYASLISGLTLTVALVIGFGFLDPLGGEITFSSVIQGGIARSPLIGVIAMAASVVVTGVVSLFTKPPQKEKLDALFECVKDKA